jgi:hypothetical protein
MTVRATALCKPPLTSIIVIGSRSIVLTTLSHQSVSDAARQQTAVLLERELDVQEEGERFRITGLGESGVSFI